MLKKERRSRFYIFCLIIILLLSLFLIGCGEEKQKPTKVVIPKKLLKRKKIKNKKIQQKVIKEKKKIHKFIYSLTTERDPFKPFFMKNKIEENVEDNVPETPLTMYSIAQYKLKAIIKAPGKRPLAMVETSEKLGLFFSVGDYIGKEHFKVIAIGDNYVKLEKKKRGLLNEIKIVTKELTLDNEGE